MFGIFPNGLDPHPPEFLERFKELFKNFILYELKFLKVFGFWSSPFNTAPLALCISHDYQYTEHPVLALGNIAPRKCVR